MCDNDMADIQSKLSSFCEEIRALALKEGYNLEGDKSPSSKPYFMSWPKEIDVNHPNFAFFTKLQFQYDKSLETILNSCYLQELQLDPTRIIETLQQHFNNSILRYADIENISDVKDESPMSFDTEHECTDTSEDISDKSEISSTNSDNPIQNCYPTYKRSFIKHESRGTLEKIFKVKQCPNTSERLYIAQKLDLTPSQVRIWFTNKRMRAKKHTTGKGTKRKSKKYPS